MKILSLKIKNLGKIADETIEFNKPLLLFFGDLKQGKSTILKAVKWICGGDWPEDIIRHGEKEGSGSLNLDGGMISHEWYRAKSGETKARPLVFILNGVEQPNPTFEVQRLFNPFLSDQDYLVKMKPLERKQYFTKLFAVDTKALDSEYFNVDRDATNLRSKIKGYGEINLVEVALLDITAIKAKRQEIVEAGNKAADSVTAWNLEANRHNSNVERGKEKIGDVNKRIAALNAELDEAKAEKLKIEAWLEKNPEIAVKPFPAPPDTSVLDAQISDAAAAQVRFEQYQKDKKRADEKTADENLLKAKTERLRAIKAEKIAKLEAVSKDCKIKGLTFDENGNFRYEETDAEMLSTSQLMKLSSELSALYPAGLGIELLDRGESLGRAIYDYVEHAKKNNTTVLATVVGDRPAKAPADVGVFVVKDGVIFPDAGSEPKAAE